MKHLHLGFYIAALAYLCSFALNLLGAFGHYFNIGHFASVFFFAEMLPLFMLIILSPRRMPMRKTINVYLFLNVLIFIIENVFLEEITSNKLFDLLCNVALEGYLWIVLFRLLRLSQRSSFIWWSTVSFLFVRVAAFFWTMIDDFVLHFSIIDHSYVEYLSTINAIKYIPPIALCISLAQFYKTFRT